MGWSARGLVLGGEDLKRRVRDIMVGSDKGDEVGWVRRSENRSDRVAAASELAERESDHCWKAWLKVHLGGEKRIDVARTLGYKDGSAITHALKRFEAKILNEPQIASYASDLGVKFEQAYSSFKR